MLRAAQANFRGSVPTEVVDSVMRLVAPVQCESSEGSSSPEDDLLPLKNFERGDSDGCLDDCGDLRMMVGGLLTICSVGGGDFLEGSFFASHAVAFTLEACVMSTAEIVSIV